MDFLNGHWQPFFAILSVNMIALISPGPDFAVTVRNSLLYARRAGVVTALGIMCGEIIHLLYTVLGFGLIISQTLWLFTLIKIIGACYLIYSGYRALKTAKTATLIDAAGEGTGHCNNFMSWRAGFYTNLLNPKAILFFLSIFTVIVPPQTPLPVLLTFGAAITMQTFLWFACVALIFSSARIRQLFADFNHWIERVTGGILIILGAKLFFLSSTK